VGIRVRTGLDRGYPQRGPYEASEGIYPGRGQGKTGGGQESISLDRGPRFSYIQPYQKGGVITPDGGRQKPKVTVDEQEPT
jgi:hypothetical protein